MSHPKRLLRPEECVDDCLQGLVAAHPVLELHAKHRVILDKSPPGLSNVAVISGGGSGHEPFAAGYVGNGMLTAAVCGSVFASPPAQHIHYAIRQAAKTRGPNGSVLVITPNYTGDVLNFGLAVELARAEGLNVQQVVIGEDIAVNAHAAGRRGMTGLIAIFKITGYLASKGASLQEVAESARSVLSNMGSIGLALTACTLPGAPAPLFALAPDEAILGVGVHGEAGITRLPLPTAASTAKMLTDRLVSNLNVTSGSKVVILVNNLGSLLGLEVWAVAGEVVRVFNKLGVQVLRIFVAPFFTSLDMSGVQVCCIVVSDTNQTNWLDAFDANTGAPAWPGNSSSIPPKTQKQDQFIEEHDNDDSILHKGPTLTEKSTNKLCKMLQTAAIALEEAEEKLNLLDSGCGDGDCGSTLKRLALEIKNSMKNKKLVVDRPAILALQLAQCSASAMGGTSGAVYSLLLTAAAKRLEIESSVESPLVWANVWHSAIQGVQEYSTARVGDRTMFDALEPACDAFKNSIKDNKSSKQALQLAVDASIKGCNSTKEMKARAGRASYVDQSELNDVDAGAYAVTVWLRALNESFL